jgi:hypothetical protein
VNDQASRQIVLTEPHGHGAPSDDMFDRVLAEGGKLPEPARLLPGALGRLQHACDPTGAATYPRYGRAYTGVAWGKEPPGAREPPIGGDEHVGYESVP